MAKILCVLYPDPVDGYPTTYARDDVPVISSYPGGQTAPTPHAIDFVPGQLLGSVSGELGLRRISRARVIPSSSRRTRKDPTRSSSGSCLTPTSSSPSRSGPRT